MRDQILAFVERHIGRDWRPSGDENIVMPCPFHSTKDGKPFSVNLVRGLFHCFTCHVGGSMPQMLKLMGMPEEQIKVEVSGFADALEANRELHNAQKQARWFFRDPFAAETPLSPVLLKPFEWCPTSLLAQGFNPEILRQQQVGVDTLNQRITYPIFDLYGNLAGLVGGRIYPYQEPKYLVYSGRKKDPKTGRIVESDFGPWFNELYPDYTFRNHDYLWGFEQVYSKIFYGKEVQTLIVVEGFKARLWLLQNGYQNVVAAMGSKLSEQQKQLIFRARVNVILFLDNDLAGQDGMRKDGEEMYRKQSGVWIARYPANRPGCQPDHLRSPSELHEAIAGALHYPVFQQGAST